MFKFIWKSVALAGLVTALTSPAKADIPVRIVWPSIEIQIGHTSPPRLRREAAPRSPGRDYRWIRGSWDWQGDQWVWIDGRWDRPDRRGVRWIPARTQPMYGSWRYVPGHWSHQVVVEGENYRRWRADRQPRRGNGKHHGRGHGRRGH